MACSMCEAHINDAVRNAFPVEKVSSSYAKGKTVIFPRSRWTKTRSAPPSKPPDTMWAPSTAHRMKRRGCSPFSKSDMSPRRCWLTAEVLLYIILPQAHRNIIPQLHRPLHAGAAEEGRGLCPSKGRMKRISTNHSSFHLFFVFHPQRNTPGSRNGRRGCFCIFRFALGFSGQSPRTPGRARRSAHRLRRWKGRSWRLPPRPSAAPCWCPRHGLPCRCPRP